MAIKLQTLEIKKLNKTLAQHLSVMPIVNERRENIRINITDDVDSLSKDALIKVLANSENFTFYFSYSAEAIGLDVHVPETDEQFNDRINKQKSSLREWEVRKVYLEGLVQQQIAKEKAEKEARDSKYKDPEYIEYLRLQKSIKEKGYD